MFIAGVKKPAGLFLYTRNIYTRSFLITQKCFYYFLLTVLLCFE